MTRARRSIVLVAAVVLFAVAGTTHAAIPQAERDALIAFYDATGGPGWIDNTGWLGPPGGECLWWGVVCDPGENHVDSINLPGNNLTGYLPADLADLTLLVQLFLPGNQIGGEIPVELTTLANLGWLVMPGNQLSGHIPPEIGDLSNLVGLDLSHNRLLGQLPPELGALSNLSDLRLADNRLTGPIPPELGNLVFLGGLHLWANQLEGPIPPELGNLANLYNLSIDFNRLNGPIPPELADLTALEFLNLGANQLTGSIPPELATLPNLWWLGLNDNQLTGPIPPEFGTFQSLVELHLSRNRLTDTIPPELGNIANLQWLFLGGNQLVGAIPTELTDASTLIGLFLEDNLLSGSIPPELGTLAQLSQLNLSGNMLEGTIPPQLGTLMQLQNLDLSRNHLEGTIPPEIGNLLALEHLHLSSNKLVGEIPPQIANLTVLFDFGSSVDFNGVHTDDPGVANFMDLKFGGGWRESQTVPPENLVVNWVTGHSSSVSWDEILYQWDHGGYEIHVATDVGGPYERYGRTLGKHMRRWPIYDLAPSSTYYVKLCTVTDPHPGNHNTVVSELTDPVTVTTTGDPSTWYVATTGDPANDCATPATPCSMIQDAMNRSAPGEQILVGPGTYHEHLSIGHPLRIVGDGADTTVIDADGGSTVIWVSWARNLKLSGVTLRGGRIDLGGGVFVSPRAVFDFSDGIIADSHANALGGGLFVDHDGGARLERVAIVNNVADQNAGGVGSSNNTHIFLIDSTVSGNLAPMGGGMFLTGYSSIERTAVDGNVAESFGGGGIATEGLMVISDTAITNNSAAHGGGIANLGGGVLEVGNTTISGNTGGGLFNDRWGWTEVESCTVTDNHSNFGEHSGVMNWNNLYLHNTIIAANTPLNCANPVTSLGYNLEDDSTCGLSAAGDLSNTDPLLGPLADNGGPTLTHALPMDSPAIDAGDPADFPATDQRGFDRPNDGDSDGIPAPDIGALENVEMVFTDGFESGDVTRWSLSVP